MGVLHTLLNPTVLLIMFNNNRDFFKEVKKFIRGMVFKGVWLSFLRAVGGLRRRNWLQAGDGEDSGSGKGA